MGTPNFLSIIWELKGYFVESYIDIYYFKIEDFKDNNNRNIIIKR